MGEYSAYAYLDNYNIINVSLSKRFCNGVSARFDLLLDDEIHSLEIVGHKRKKDTVEYSLYFEGNLEIGKPYEVMMANGYTVPLTYRYIVKTKRFNEEFFYANDDLGAVVNEGSTTFKVWAPTASDVLLIVSDKPYKMARKSKGIFTLSFKSDLTGNNYHYVVTINGNTYITTDPYGKASTANGKENVVVSLPDYKAKFSGQSCPPVIYEASIRDLSDEGTFVSFENNIDYLKQLGITHLQLLPVNDFGSVNEYYKDIYYNWGYDPVQYMSLEGSYSTDVRNPLAVIDEFKGLVSKLHKAGIKVILDVVFNHHYYAERSSFNRLVPYYFFRIDDEDKFYDGTGCGSECDSEQLMCRKFIADTLQFYVAKYDVDGFRFDLMDFIDIDTMNNAFDKCKKLKKDIWFYGEGWKIPAGTSLDVLAHYDNSAMTPDIGYFNDQFREVIKGNTFSLVETGYGSGNVWMSRLAVEVIKGTRFSKVEQSINYVECHDNYTCYDKLMACCINESEKQLENRTKLIIGIVLLAQGRAFLHAGQEYCASKNGLPNTYNGPESANKQTEQMRQRHKHVIDYTKAMIQIKKEYNIGINSYEIYENNGAVIYKVNGLTILINPSVNGYNYYFDGEMKLICDENGNEGGSCYGECSVPPISIYVLGREQ